MCGGDNDMALLTEKQKRFADYYIETGNMTEAAIKAGYSKKTARVIGQENLLKPAIKNYVDERLKELEEKRVASATEVMQLLTSAMRGELDEEVVVVESIGDYCSEARVVKKKIGLKDRIKAAELIGKRHRLFTDKIQVDGLVPVMITGEDEIED